MAEKEMSPETNYELMRLAERDYEDALSRLRALGWEPNIHRMPASVAPLLDVLQGGVEMNEEFPLTTEVMGMMLNTINDIREEIGHDRKASPLPL